MGESPISVSSKIILQKSVKLGAVLILIGYCLITDGWVLRRWGSRQYGYLQWSPNGNNILTIHQGTYQGEKLVVISKYLPVPRLIFTSDDSLSAFNWRTNFEVSIFTQNLSLDKNTFNVIAKPATLHLVNVLTKRVESIESPLSTPTGITWNPDGTVALAAFRYFHEPENAPPGIYKFSFKDKQFTLWRSVELPEKVDWSSSGRYVAYTELVKSSENAGVYRLTIIDMVTEKTIKTVLLSGKKDDAIWNVYGNTGLSWSADESWILLSGRYMEPGNVKRGFFIIPIQEDGNYWFWEPSVPSDAFDLSPNGRNLAVTTVSNPWSGKNQLHILLVSNNLWKPL